MGISPATFAVLLTAGGAPIAAAIIQQVIDFAKNGLGISFVYNREKLISFICAIGIVVIAAIVGLSEVPPRYNTGTTLDIILFVVGLALAVYNIGRLSMAIHDDKTKKDDISTVRNTAGWGG